MNKLLRFTDENSGQDWFSVQSKNVAVTLATRSALRVLPLLGDVIAQENNIFERIKILTFFRSIMVANCSSLRISGLEENIEPILRASSTVSFTPLGSGRAHSVSSSIHNALRSVANNNNKNFNASYAVENELAARYEHTDPKEIFKAIYADADAILDKEIAYLPIWLGVSPELIISTSWENLRDALISAEDEDWGVWTDWYEAQLRGDPVDIDLERAKALIPNEIWEQGPKVANAEIRRLINEHEAKKRSKAEEQVSPHPAIDTSGKLHAIPTPGIDLPDDSPDLPDLLRRQRAVLGTILDGIATMHGNDFRTSPGALNRYNEEIASHGLRLSIGYLDDMRAIARSEYLSLYREKFFDTEAGLRRALLNFFALHKEIQTHYPLDAERRTLLESFDTPIDRPDPAALEEIFEDIKEGMAAAVKAEAMTGDYVSYMGGMMEGVASITYTPSLAGMPTDGIDPELVDPPSPRMGLRKQLYLKLATFSGATRNLLENIRIRDVERQDVIESIAIYTFIYTTPVGAKFLAAIDKLWMILWALF